MRNGKWLLPPLCPWAPGPTGEKCSVWKGDRRGEAAQGLSFVISLQVYVLFPLIDHPSMELNTFILNVMETYCTEGCLHLLGPRPAWGAAHPRIEEYPQLFKSVDHSLIFSLNRRLPVWIHPLLLHWVFITRAIIPSSQLLSFNLSSTQYELQKMIIKPNLQKKLTPVTFVLFW